MRRFKRRKSKKKSSIFVLIFLIFITDIFLFNIFGNRLSSNISKMTKVKIEEISKYYMNSVIKKYLNIDTSNYIKLNFVNNNIVSIDINNNESNKLLKNVIDDLEGVVRDIEKGKINDYNNLEFIYGNKCLILLVPLGTAFNNTLLYDIGPKIPVKVSFLENVDAYLDVSVEEYGINNALVKLYININMEQIIEMPIDKDRTVIEYRFLIASKLVNGIVPSIYGYGLKDNSNLVKNNVN